ncbi:hypothetical protein PGB90_005771 [Kerria lacca]
MNSVLLPPECVRGMVSLNESVFKKIVKVPVLNIEGLNLINCITTSLKQYLLKLENFKSVQCNKNNEKIIYLNPDLVSCFRSFNDDVVATLTSLNIFENRLTFCEITLTFDNWKAHEIIAAILPPCYSFSGFSVIGTIIHVNLKNELLSYKHIIAEVLLKKLKYYKSVVNKINNIENTFRNFEMEILAGSNDLKTEVKENGCKFELNFREVYWNPRLHEEHAKIVNKLNQGDVLYDVCCGIGPFSIPAAKCGCEVLANDLNPACCKWLQRNVIINKINSRLKIFNKPGDEFIKEDIKNDILKHVTNDKNDSIRFHITMNLPASAYTFLPVFVGLFNENELSIFEEHHLPIIHLYCFMKNSNNFKEEAKALIEETLNVSDICYLEIRNVRNVAPNKEMIRISFAMNKKILGKTAENNKHYIENESHFDAKRLKL